MRILLTLFLLINLGVFGQNTQENTHQDNNEILQSKIDNLQRQIDDYKQHNKELLEAKATEIEKIMNEKEQALDSRMLIYISFFISAFLIAIGFFRWLGKAEIRRIVNDQAIKQIDMQLQLKMSNEIIDKKLTSLGKPIIEQLLNEISTSNQKAKASIDKLEESNREYKRLLEDLGSRKNEIDPTKSAPEEKEKIKEFTEVLDKVKEESDFSAKDWFLKGKQAYSKGDNEKAIGWFTESIKLNIAGKDLHYAFYYRGLSKFNLSKYKEAIEDFNEAENVFPGEGYLYFIRGNAYWLLKQNNEALTDLNKVKDKLFLDSAKSLKEDILIEMKKNGS